MGKSSPKYYVLEGVHGAYHAGLTGTRTTACGLTGYSLQSRRHITKITCPQCKAAIRRRKERQS